jgi:hypothetical protein
MAYPQLVHHKQRVLDMILVDADPNDRHIKQWTSNNIQVKRLLRDMVKDQLITIEYIHKGGTCKRYLKQLVSQIVDHPEL